MGWFDTTTTKKTNTVADKTYGLSDEINAYAGSLGGLYNPANYGNAWAGINPYQSAAAQNQQGLLGQLMPAYNQAMSIGATGIDPNRIAAFYNPATQGMVDATNRSLDRTDAIGRTRDQVWMAKQGALGGTQGRNNRMMGDFTRDQSRAAAIAGLYNDAWSKAAGLAGQSAGLQMAGLGAAGTLAGAQSGLNQSLFNFGTGLQQTDQAGRLISYDLAQKNAQTLAGLAQGSGEHATGKENSTAVSSPSVGAVGAGLAGSVLNAWAKSDARIKDNIKVIGETFDGQPIYKYNFKGSPKTEIGLMAQDVEQHDPEAVSEANGIKMVDYDRATEGAERKADGGGVMAPYQGSSDAKDPHARLMKAFHSIRGMMRSNGGPVIKPFAYGGDVGLGSWAPTVNSPSLMDKFGDNSKAIGDYGASAANFFTNLQKQGTEANEQALSQSPLSKIMSGMMGGSKGFADGGSPRVDFGRKIYDFFVAHGLPPHQAAAVAGNMAWEGGGRADLVSPGDNWRNSPRAPHSIGIAQWNDRSPALVEYAKSQGIEIPDGDLRDKRYAQDVIRRIPLDEQLKFAWHEMQGPERRAYDRITRADDLYAGTAAATGYHRPAGWTPSNPHNAHGLAGRYDLAQKILNSTGGDRPVEAPATSGVAPFSSAPQPPDGMDATSYASKSVIPAYTAVADRAVSDADLQSKLPSPYRAAEMTSDADEKPKESGSFLQEFSKNMGSSMSESTRAHENANERALDEKSTLSKLIASMMGRSPKGFFGGGVAGGNIQWVDGQPIFPSSHDDGPSYLGGPKSDDPPQPNGPSNSPGETYSPITLSTAKTRGPLAGSSPPPSASGASPAKTAAEGNLIQRFFKYGKDNADTLEPLSLALMKIGNGPFAPAADALLEVNNQRLKQQSENRALAALMGRLKDGTPTFEAQEKSGLIPINGTMVPTLDKQKLNETSRLHNANIGLLEKQTQNEGLKPNPLTGDYYSADPKSPFYPQVGTPDPDAGMSAAVRKAWATKVAPEQIGKLSEAYNTANDTVNKFNDMEALLPHMVSGKWANVNLEGRKILSLAGIGDPTKIAATEIARALSQTLILDATKNLKPASNLDLQFTAQATTTINNHPETLQVLLPGLRAAAQRAQLKAELELKEVKAGRIPDAVAIDKAVDESIPSPIKKYGEYLDKFSPSGKGAAPTASASPRAAPAVAPIEPPPEAIKKLIENQTNPKAIEDFNKAFNGGKPGLAESKISDATAGSQPAAKSPKEYDPHNLIRRFFGYDPT